MNLRKILKTGEFHTRRARVRALAVPRALPWLRRGLNLPPNAVVNPLQAGASEGIAVTLLDPTESFTRPMPEAGSSPEAKEFFGTRCREDCSQSYVAEISGGYVWGNRDGAVFAPDGRFIPVLSRDPWGPSLHSVWSRMHLPKPLSLPGRTLYLVTPEATDNYHHWVIDLLPRIGLVARAGFAPADFDHVIINHAGRRYQKDSLAALGIAEEKLITATEQLHVRAEMLVVPSLKSHNQCLPSADISFLRQRFLGGPGTRKPGRRLFISRRGAAFRQLRNESELLPILEDYGFEVVSLGELQMKEQAEFFSEAEWVVGVSGAGFSNLVFASPSARVVELAPPQWLSVYHWMISARLNLSHTVILGDGPAWSGHPEISGRSRDVTLSAPRLAAVLERNLERATA
jgi:capsular polysaccharide biosynthesis protein